MTLTLAPVDAALCQACTSEGWFLHSEANRLMGFGKGEEGIVKFMVDYFEEALRRDKEDADFELMGVYEAEKPVGFFGLEYLGSSRRAIHFFQFMSPGSNGLGEEALTEQLKALFKRREIVRAETEVLHINRNQAAVLKSCGMIQEGRKRSAFWMGDANFDVLNFGLLRNRHRMLKQGKRRGRK